MKVRLPTASAGKRVIGIDLATTRCCIASAAATWEELENLHGSDSRPPNVDVFSGWTVADDSSKTNPITALYYEKPTGLPMTGNDLDPILKSERRIGATTFDTEKFFRLWKLMFHDDQNDPATKEIQVEIQRKLDRLGLTRKDLLSGWVGSAYSSIFEEANGEVKYRHRDPRIMDLEVVIAVPPGRSAVAHDEVLQGFIQGPIRAHQVSLVSEPEAMFRSWVADGVDIEHWKVRRPCRLQCAFLTLFSRLDRPTLSAMVVEEHAYGKTLLLSSSLANSWQCFVRFRLDQLDPLGFTQEFESESMGHWISEYYT